MRAVKIPILLPLIASIVAGWAVVPATQAQNNKKPNIVVIMGDDIGMWNIGAYHRGLIAARTPDIDRLAREGAIFTDYYAEASCTAGRANFITGQLPIRTGLTTVGQAGAKIGMPAAAPTIATALRDMGYTTRQFGKNHLGDRNEFLPTLHGFDEFFGYLYHLDAMQDPFHPGYPQRLKNSATSCTAGRPTWMTQPSTRVGARLASKRLPTRVLCRLTALMASSTTWRIPTTKS